MLKIPSPEAPNREREAKIPQWKGGTGCQNTLKHIIEVHVPAMNRDDGALCEVGAKIGNNTETLKNNRQILNVLLDRSHKHGRIIHI
jgi:hypothetical protein